MPNTDHNPKSSPVDTRSLLITGQAGADGGQTMSSREIADLTGKRHDNVRADIDRMANELSLTFQEKSELSSGGRPSKVYLLPKRESLILVSGYNLAMRAKIIDRWQQLEDAARFDPARTLSDASALRGLLLHYAEKQIELQGEIEEMRPQVQALERIALSDGSLCITDAAKTLQVQPKALFAFLRSHGWIFSRGGGSDIAYQSKLQAGLLEHKTTVVTRSDGSEKTTTQVRVTPKGLARLAREFQPVARAA